MESIEKQKNEWECPRHILETVIGPRLKVALDSAELCFNEFSLQVPTRTLWNFLEMGITVPLTLERPHVYESTLGLV